MKPVTLKLMFALYFFSTIIITFAQNHAVNHSAAEQLCADKGGLVPSFNFPRVDVSLTDFGQSRDSIRYSQLKNVELEDGESAWVAGYAKYGDSLYYHFGCCPYDNQNTFAESDKQDHRGFYQCSDYCENRASGTAYYDQLSFLINATNCVCIKNMFVLNRTACPETIKDGLLLELYRRISRYLSDGLYQCATVRYNNNKSNWETLTSKCLGNKAVVCNNIRQNISCQILNTFYTISSNLCDVDSSDTWMNGVKECNNIGGMVMPYLSREIFMLDKNIQYWLGYVSAYKLKTHPGHACLSATRVGDRLVLEPSDCVANNKFVCASDIKPDSDVHMATSTRLSTPINEQTTLSNAVPASTRLYAFTTTPKVLTSSQAASSVGTNTVLITAACCSVGVVGGGVAIAFLIYRRKRKSNNDCTHHVMTQPSLDTRINDNRITAASESHYTTVDENDMVQAKSAARAPSDTSFKSTASDDTRDKNSPTETQTRNPLKRKKHFEPCENIPLSRTPLANRNKNGKDTNISMSDKCNVLPSNQPTQPARKREECEAHIYINQSAEPDRKREECEAHVYINQSAQPDRKREECEAHVYTNQQIIQQPDNTYTHLSNALRDNHIYGHK